MQIHALGLGDFCEEEYSLIGIHTALEDYKLAYLLNKNLKGVVITYISNQSVVAGYLQVGDIILEVQKNKISNTKQFNNLIENIYKKGEKTILLVIINKNNQRRYLGIKTN